MRRATAPFGIDPTFCFHRGLTVALWHLVGPGHSIDSPWKQALRLVYGLSWIGSMAG